MAASDIKMLEVEEKGKLRIPRSVLEQLPFAPKGRFLILHGSDFITFKKINKALPQERFQSVAQEVQKKTKALKISRKTAEEAVKWARKK